VARHFLPDCSAGCHVAVTTRVLDEKVQVNVAKRVARDPLLDCRAGFSCCCDYKVARLKDCQVPVDYKGCQESSTRFPCRLSCCCDYKVARSSA